jgi:hypothetical protein
MAASCASPATYTCSSHPQVIIVTSASIWSSTFISYHSHESHSNLSHNMSTFLLCFVLSINLSSSVLLLWFLYFHHQPFHPRLSLLLSSSSESHSKIVIVHMISVIKITALNIYKIQSKFITFPIYWIEVFSYIM